MSGFDFLRIGNSSGKSLLRPANTQGYASSFIHLYSIKYKYKYIQKYLSTSTFITNSNFIIFYVNLDNYTKYVLWKPNGVTI